MFIFFTFFTLTLLPLPAHAYLDPGTGSMIIHLIIGGIASGLVTIKVFWAKIALFFSKATPIDDEELK